MARLLLPRAGAVAVGTAALLLAVLPATPAGAIGYQLPKADRLINSNSGKCLEVADWRTDNGAPVRQWDCTGGANQIWEFRQVNYYAGEMLVNKHSGKCLEIGGWSTADGTPASQWDCHGGLNQVWANGSNWNVPKGPRELGFINAHSHGYLEVADYRTDNGAPVRQWRDGTGWNKYWTVPGIKLL
ncbi:RICIN domain-containing protein [Kitasatospora sp. NPDC004240]